jgi:archaellum biogenesis ATPase FlaH
VLQKINEGLGSLSDKCAFSSNTGVITARVNNLYSFEVCVNIIETLINQGMGGTIVSTDRPASYIQKVLEKNKVSLENIYFIDAVTGISAQSAEMLKIEVFHPECTSFLDTPFNLTALGEEIRKNVKKTKNSENNFLLLDSMLSLIFYNTVEDAEKFLASIRKIPKEYNITCIVMFPEKNAQVLGGK